MIEVELPDGTIAEFPEGMPNENIAAVLKRQFSQSQPATPAMPKAPTPQAALELPPEPEAPKQMQRMSITAIPEQLRIDIDDPDIPGGKRRPVARAEYQQVTNRLSIYNKLLDCLAE